jgi:DNA-binding GntR family transcriptional regulator
MAFVDPRRYMHVADRVRTQIREGRLHPGDHVSRSKLLADTGYSIRSVAHGLQVLEREGLLARIPGLGYYVTGNTHDMT